MNSLRVTVSIIFSLSALVKDLRRQPYREMEAGHRNPGRGQFGAIGRFLEGKNKEMFIAFIRGMLQWRPEDRKTAKELLQDPWLNG